MCRFTLDGITTFSYNVNHCYKIATYMNCQTKYCVYVISCLCGKIYVGSTIRSIHERVLEHWRAIRTNDQKYPVAFHASICTVKTFKFHGIEHIVTPRRGGDKELLLRRREAVWIMRLKAVQNGMNVDNELHYFLGD